MESPLLTLRQNGLVVRRRQRYDEEAWQGARSWLGGLPHIRLADWPRHQRNRTPLFHLAQINFADFPAGPWSPYLPETGALCVFHDVGSLERHESPTMVYVPDPEKLGPCSPPEDCLPIAGKDTWYKDHMNRDRLRYEDAQRVMPRWPVDFVAVKCSARSSDDGHEIDYDPPLDTILGPHPEYVCTPAPKNGPRTAPVCLRDEVPWEAARRVVVAVQNNAVFDPALDMPSGLMAKLKEYSGGARRRQVAILDFLDRWTPLLKANDPYATMAEDQASLFSDNIWALRRNEMISDRCWYGVTEIFDAGRDVYREMMLGSREMYEKIPPQVRDRIQNEWRTTGSHRPHQIFGPGVDLQGYLEDWESHFMLFQATFDYMMDWQWGDLGVVQFFITPEDLAVRNWAGVKGDYTCG